MSNSIAKWHEMQSDKDKAETARWLKLKSREIEHTDPKSHKAAELRWLFDNYHKILRNRNLIDLIG